MSYKLKENTLLSPNSFLISPLLISHFAMLIPALPSRQVAICDFFSSLVLAKRSSLVLRSVPQAALSTLYPLLSTLYSLLACPERSRRATLYFLSSACILNIRLTFSLIFFSSAARSRSFSRDTNSYTFSISRGCEGCPSILI